MTVTRDCDTWLSGLIHGRTGPPHRCVFPDPPASTPVLELRFGTRERDAHQEVQLFSPTPALFEGQLEAGQHPGILKTTLGGWTSANIWSMSNKSAQEVYYAGATPSALRFRNGKMSYSMTKSEASGCAEPNEFHWTILANIKRDPFERKVLFGDAKALANVQGALAGPMTADA